MKKLLFLLVTFMALNVSAQAQDLTCQNVYREALQGVREATENYLKYHHERTQYVVDLNQISAGLNATLILCALEDAVGDQECFTSYKSQYEQVRGRLKTFAILRKTQTDEDIKKAMPSLATLAKIKILDIKCKYSSN